MSDSQGPGAEEYRDEPGNLGLPPIQDLSAIPQVIPLTRPRFAIFGQVVAWAAILAMVVVVHSAQEQKRQGKPSEGVRRLSMLVPTAFGKYQFVRAETEGNRAELFRELEEQSHGGSLEQRLTNVVMAGELKSYAEALDRLHDLDRKLAANGSKQDAKILAAKAALEKLYRDYDRNKFDAPSLNQQDRDNLRSTLGWFGDLALAPAHGNDSAARQAVREAAERSTLLLVGLFLLLLLVGTASLVSCIAFIMLAMSGRLRSYLRTGDPMSSVYIETFALWMILFVLLQGIVGQMDLDKANTLWALGLCMLASLVALVWPVWRGGLSWRQVRQDIGLKATGNPVLEPLYGVFGYFAAMPIAAVGIMIFFLIIVAEQLFRQHTGNAVVIDEFAPEVPPSHPVIEYLSGPGIGGKLQVFLLASVCAPIVEEIMFRGVFYRYMRELTGCCSFVASFLTSCLIVSFIFAVIHPQGLETVPALMGLAIGFTILRECRDSVIPGMVAHACNNTLILSIAVLIFQSLN